MIKDIGLFYGSTSGATESVAEKITEKAKAYDIALEPSDVCYASDITELLKYKKLILGTPTWYFGEHQGDWEELIDDMSADTDFSGVTFAMFGLGDQEGYPDWYLDAMGMIAEELIKRGATQIGQWSTEGYAFDESKAVLEAGKFCGLALDEDCQPEQTDDRLDTWLADILPQFKAI